MFQSSDSVANYELYLPADVCFVRCVYIHPLEEQYDITTDSTLQADAQHNACALLQIDFTIDIGTWHNSVRGGTGQTTVDELTTLATMSSHPELAVAPWVVFGFSAGGFFATTFGQQFPERTIAVASWHGGQPVSAGGADLSAILQVPIVYFAGWCDQTDLWTGDLAAFTSVRSQGAPAAFAPELIGHSPQNDGTLTWPYLDAIIPERLPASWPATGPVTLNTIDQSTGFLADYNTGDYWPAGSAPGSPDTLSWLPDETIAAAWKAFVLNDGSQNGSNSCHNGPQPPRP
jgi:dienelactone hydrolase